MVRDSDDQLDEDNGVGVLEDTAEDDQLEAERQALILLKKLQDLKVWQSRQEERLLEEQRYQLLSLEQLGLSPADIFQQAGRRDYQQHDCDDDTTISSLAYDEEDERLSVLSEENEESREHSTDTWADRNNRRPETKNLELSNGSLMTVSGERGAEHGPPPLSSPAHRPPPPAAVANVEERPVGGAGRTFAQLMSEKLGTDSRPEPLSAPPIDSPAAMIISAVAPTSPGGRGGEPRPFLKRGSGLSRFNLPPDPALQPSRLQRGRSRSSPKLGIDSQDLRNPARLSQETVSFACKKSPPRSTSTSTTATTRRGLTNSRSLGRLADGEVTGTKLSPVRKAYSPPRLKLQSKKDKENSTKNIISNNKKEEVTNNSNRGTVRPSLNLQDSVENSFREKLVMQEQRHEKELKELAVFEMLEDAANDTSFCSTSSRVKTLMDASILPSPGRPRPGSLSSSTPIVSRRAGGAGTEAGSSGSLSQISTSTPIVRDGEAEHRHLRLPDPEDPSLGETLMEDIRRFVLNKDRPPGSQPSPPLPRGKNVQAATKTSQHDSVDVDDNDDEEDDDDSTICDDDNVSIGKNWRERLAEIGKENIQTETNGPGAMLEFSPPGKMPRNCPSYLIWSIFTREREERRLRALQRKNLTPQGNQQTATAAAVGVRSAPAGGKNAQQCRAAPASPLSLAPNLQSNDDLTYQSTLLHMRVVELELEIETFKKENVKISQLKKKLNEEKVKITKEWEEFEKLREDGKKKLEEEKKRLKRDKLLLEKAQRELQNAIKVCTECEENRNKIIKMQEDLSSKESKWTAALSKLQEQVNKMEKENRTLHSENQRFRLKNVSSKVATTTSASLPGGGKVPPSGVKVVSHINNNNKKAESNSNSTPNSSTPDHTPDSGIRTRQGSSGRQSSEEDDSCGMLDNELRQSISSTLYAALCGETPTPRMCFSPVESLESSMTLVSGVTRQDLIPSRQDQPQIINNSEKGTREKKYPDGRVEIWYSNGNRKEVSADGRMVKIFYYNGDLKESHSSGLVKYLYSQTQTWHITQPDGREVLQFSNGQEEVRHPDGSMEISFPDGSHKRIAGDGAEDITFPDGTRVQVSVDGNRVLHLPNGQREEHTKDTKKRIYPDGTVKILHQDGRQETRYANGRVRIKDQEGKLIHDSQQH